MKELDINASLSVTHRICCETEEDGIRQMKADMSYSYGSGVAEILDYQIVNDADACSFLHARLAYSKSSSVKRAGANKQLNSINKKIHRATESGAFSIYLQEPLLPGVRSTLDKLGYRVESSTQYNVPETTISWKHFSGV